LGVYFGCVLQNINFNQKGDSEMNANSSLTCKHEQMVLFPDFDLPVDVVPVEENEAVNLMGDVTNHPTFPIDFIYRDLPDLVDLLPSGFSGLRLGDPDEYPFDFMCRLAKISFFPLDNPPGTDEQGSASKTSFDEAHIAQKSFWRGNFSPVDIFALAEIVHGKLGVDTLLFNELKGRYLRYRTVYILFTDPIFLGESVESYYIVLEASNGFQDLRLNVVSGDKVVSLSDGETVITACVSRTDVIMSEIFLHRLGREESCFEGRQVDSRANSADISPDWLELVKGNRR
jgi:hypothetical protein